MTNDLKRLQKLIDDIDRIKTHKKLDKDPEFMKWRIGVGLLLRKLDLALHKRLRTRRFNSPSHMRRHSMYKNKQNIYLSALEETKADLLALFDHLNIEQPKIDYSKISWTKVTCYKFKVFFNALKFWKTPFYKKHTKAIIIFIIMTILGAVITLIVNHYGEKALDKFDESKIEIEK